MLAGSDVDCGVPPSRTLPLLPDADLVSFLDATFGLASAPNVSLASRASCYSRLLLRQYNYGLGVIDEANRVLAINYHSQMVTKAVWTRWSRQARGTVVHLLPSGRFTLLKRLLDRGVEMLLNVHLETEIAATQDIRLSPKAAAAAAALRGGGGDARYAALLEHSYSYLTPVQRETGRLVNTGTAFDGLLTMKVEGSLSCFCVAFAGTYAYALVDKLIAALPDTPGPARHAKRMAEMARPHGFLVVMSSHRINHFLMVDSSPQRDDVWFWHVPALIFGMLGVPFTPALAERARATPPTPPPPTPPTRRRRQQRRRRRRRRRSRRRRRATPSSAVDRGALWVVHRRARAAAHLGEPAEPHRHLR